MRLRPSSLKTSLARYVRVPATLPSDMSTCGTCKAGFLHFRPLPVTILTVVIYLALFIPLLIIHYVPPSPPPIESLKASIGVDLEETWHSLAGITKKYHPYNSHANDEVKTFLMDTIHNIITRNGNNRTSLIEDTSVNVFYAGSQKVSIYFESLNIIVKIEGNGWFEGEPGDVLVNAHYDSVSTAPGATDDGVAVVTVLGLIDYFTNHPSHAPRRNVVFLLNNGEEDYLNGAVAFTEHPIAQKCRIFLNLEGAGAGGRATLFRSTDAEVTKFYKRAKYPFGVSLSGDAFKRGVIRSQTDYIIFDGDLGMRGLDVAFWQPRARYHTQWDSMAFTSINSLWHMFETALAATTGMAADPTYTFIQGSGSRHTGVWFDMFGHGFAVFNLSTAFVLSMCLLTITPFLIFTIIYFIAKTEKLYLFASSPKSSGPLPAKLELAGFKGFWRPLVAIAVSTGAVFGVGMLIAKVNPMIMYSSQEAVWVCLMSLWIILNWSILRLAAAWRPTATARSWALAWISMIFWVLLIGNAVAEDRLDLGGLYFIIFYYMATALSLLLSLLELFLLPPTSSVFDSIPAGPLDIDDDDRNSLIAPSVDGDNRQSSAPEDEDDEPANETTSLLRDPSNLGRGRHIGRRPNSHGSLSIGGASTLPTIETNEDDEPECSSGINCSQRQYPGEQYWSRGLPRYTWILQALLLIPIPVIIVSQIALIVGTSVAQTGADGNPQAFNYVLYSVFTVFILLPLLPFIHRWTYHVPFFLFLVFVGTLLYLTLAFPFSLSSPLKVYFSQTVNLETGATAVNLVGAAGYIKAIAQENLPSLWAPGVGEPQCADDPLRLGLLRCNYPAEMPNVVPGSDYRGWVKLNTSLVAKPVLASGTRTVKLNVLPANSRACRVLLDRRVFNVTIRDPTGKGVTTDHNNPIPEHGTDHIRLWSRDWGRGWDVEITEASKKDSEEAIEPLTGTLQCLWSDVNEKGTIPAFDEIKRYLPRWSVVSKLEDGLVVGELGFKV